MSEDDIDSFVYKLTDFLNHQLPIEKYGNNFFDTDERYIPLLDFCQDFFEPYLTKERNFN